MRIALLTLGILQLAVSTASALERVPLNVLISHYAKAHGVPEALLHRVIRLESNYNPYALSRGNYGLMQIRHATARGMGYRGPPDGLLNAETNLTYGVPYLANAYRVADGDAERAIALYKNGYHYEAKRKGLEGTLVQAQARKRAVIVEGARVSPSPATITVSISSRYSPATSGVRKVSPEVAASDPMLVPPEPPRRPSDFEAPPAAPPTKDVVPAEDLVAPEPTNCLMQLRRIGITAERASAPENGVAECVVESPVRLKSLTAFGERTVTFPDGPLLACRFAERFGRWIGELAVPLIELRVAPLTAVRTGPGYECRNRNRAASGKLSAHAAGHAVDVTSFELVTGETLLVTEAKDDRKMGVLSTLRTGACGWFTTILGPGSDPAHATHWHLDIQKHGSSDNYRICN